VRPVVITTIPYPHDKLADFFGQISKSNNLKRVLFFLLATKPPFFKLQSALWAEELRMSVEAMRIMLNRLVELSILQYDSANKLLSLAPIESWKGEVIITARYPLGELRAYAAKKLKKTN
jgi:hypothetical protein